MHDLIKLSLFALPLKAPITTAADDILIYFGIVPKIKKKKWNK